MNIFSGFAAFCLATGIVCPAALAEPLGTKTTPRPSELQAARLMPLEERELGESRDTSDFSGVATRINDNLGESDSQPAEVLDPQDLPIVQGLLDDEGNVNLPLGVRVYDTMGDPSVGFGSDF